jgi:hypothetical protein
MANNPKNMLEKNIGKGICGMGVNFNGKYENVDSVTMDAIKPVIVRIDKQA